MDRNVSIITDFDGTNIVLIHDILFKGKRHVDWKDVERYLRQYVGKFYTIANTEETVYIGSDLPDEYVHSNYTKMLMGASAKDGKVYLYDIMEIKKETSKLFQSGDLTQ